MSVLKCRLNSAARSERVRATYFVSLSPLITQAFSSSVKSVNRHFDDFIWILFLLKYVRKSFYRSSRSFLCFWQTALTHPRLVCSNQAIYLWEWREKDGILSNLVPYRNCKIYEFNRFDGGFGHFFIRWFVGPAILKRKRDK